MVSGPVVLCILDGVGIGLGEEDDAVATARTPTLDRLKATCPWVPLKAHGTAVGLPSDGDMGNSEVGHNAMGAGRVFAQGAALVNQALESGSLWGDVWHWLTEQGTLHLLGLVSDGNVHSHVEHLHQLIERAAHDGVESLRVHVLTDGRDVAPKSAYGYLGELQENLPAGAKIGTVCGRYFAMDRDNRWGRVSEAYAAMIKGEGRRVSSAHDAVTHAYNQSETDEFIGSSVVGDYAGAQDGDGFFCLNFRADRAREILTALVDPVFDGFKRERLVNFATHIGMVNYSDALDPFMQTLFPSESLPNTIGEVVAAAGMRQLRIAETEKYAHVTFFLNGGQEAQFDGEDRVLIQSPDVATYDLQPEMSAPELTDRLVQEITSGTRDLIIVNYANPDMVGHTGVLPAAIKAVETVDACLGRLNDAVKQTGGVMLVTADHGNIETMVDDETGVPHTAHTSNLVPLVMVNGRAGEALQPGRLCDLAPTMLKFLNLPQPVEMTGVSLLADAATVADKQGEDRLHA